MDCSPPGSCPWDSPDKNTEVRCHFLLQGIFPTQGLNLGLLCCWQILYHLRYQGSPILVGMNWYFIVVSICISLMATQMLSIFQKLMSHSYIFFGETLIQVLCPFKNYLYYYYWGVGVLCVSWILGSYHIDEILWNHFLPCCRLCFHFLSFVFLNIYLAVPGLSYDVWELVLCLGIKPGPPVLGVWSLNHCTTRMSLSFHFLDNTFWGTFLIFMRSSLSMFLLMLLIHLVLCLRSYCLYKVMKTYTHVFFRAFYTFSSYTLMHLWVNFCIWYEVGGSNLILLYVDF